MEIILAIVMGLAFGALFERYQFCMNSAITHVFLFGGTHKLKGSLIAVLASTVLFNLLITLGLVGTGAMPLLPTTIFSGVLFGIGMNLAGGYVSGTLYKMGQGYLASWIAFLGMVSGFGAVELTLARTLDFAMMRWQGATLPMTLGVDPFMFAVLVIAVALVGYWVWGRRKVSPETGQTHTLMDWSSPLTGAILIAILNTIYFDFLPSSGIGGADERSLSGWSLSLSVCHGQISAKATCQEARRKLPYWWFLDGYKLLGDDGLQRHPHPGRRASVRNREPGGHCRHRPRRLVRGEAGAQNRVGLADW